jgi:hypothetical protein
MESAQQDSLSSFIDTRTLQIQGRLLLIVYRVDSINNVGYSIKAGFRRRRTDNFGPDPNMSERAVQPIRHSFLN